MALDFAVQCILALIQGATEIFPVSSSLHLLVAGTILGVRLSLERVIFFHLGTLFAIVWWYRRDLVGLARCRDGPELALKLGLTVAITALIGLPIKLFLGDYFIQHHWSITPLLIINGVLIFFASRRYLTGQRRITSLRFSDLLLFGIAQGLATAPGLSRLGLTLVVALAIGLTWSESLRFSFLLSIPTILMANLYLALYESTGPIISTFDAVNLLVIGLTFITSLGCLRFLTRFIVLGRSVLQFFGIYCIAAGAFFTLYLQLF